MTKPCKLLASLTRLLHNFTFSKSNSTSKTFIKRIITSWHQTSSPPWLMLIFVSGMDQQIEISPGKEIQPMLDEISRLYEDFEKIRISSSTHFWQHNSGLLFFTHYHRLTSDHATNEKHSQGFFYLNPKISVVFFHKHQFTSISTV